ncbi:hypothetical protein HI914_00673 [Erysiphe necator]|uniref:Uncharacterized protein n=1 Tax=Uncinula necator TaxID=52586 RepID=A0A0B1P6K0_UNCNE|nr:hypothetical protein HI914_00673 [Erysiphe necator]KHJ32985.1 hypothetical protein EV44_g0998 [Erysiphe necator]
MDSYSDISDRSPEEFGIETIDFKVSSSVNLSVQQKLLVGCVLDLFKGKPTLKKLKLWDDNATFNDPLTMAKGRKQYQAQWYGLKAAFSEIEQLEATVLSSTNPIDLYVKTRYKVKGIGIEKIISSNVRIFTDPSEKFITGVDDLWDSGIPNGAIAKVGLFQVLNPLFWLYSMGEVGFWMFSLIWWTRPWEIFRNLNSIVVPIFVSIPKSNESEETEKKK